MHSFFWVVKLQDQHFRAKKSKAVFQAGTWKTRAVTTLKMQGVAHCLTMGFSTNSQSCEHAYLTSPFLQRAAGIGLTKQNGTGKGGELPEGTAGPQDLESCFFHTVPTPVCSQESYDVPLRWGRLSRKAVWLQPSLCREMSYLSFPRPV